MVNTHPSHIQITAVQPQTANWVFGAEFPQIPLELRASSESAGVPAGTKCSCRKNIGNRREYVS